MFEIGDGIMYAENFESFASVYKFPVLFKKSDGGSDMLIQYITEVDFEYTDYVRKVRPTMHVLHRCRRNTYGICFFRKNSKIWTSRR